MRLKLSIPLQNLQPCKLLTQLNVANRWNLGMAASVSSYKNTITNFRWGTFHISTKYSHFHRGETGTNEFIQTNWDNYIDAPILSRMADMQPMGLCTLMVGVYPWYKWYSQTQGLSRPLDHVRCHRLAPRHPWCDLKLRADIFWHTISLLQAINELAGQEYLHERLEQCFPYIFWNRRL